MKPSGLKICQPTTAHSFNPLTTPVKSHSALNPTRTPSQSNSGFYSHNPHAVKSPTDIPRKNAVAELIPETRTAFSKEHINSPEVQNTRHFNHRTTSEPLEKTGNQHSRDCKTYQ